MRWLDVYLWWSWALYIGGLCGWLLGGVQVHVEPQPCVCERPLSWYLVSGKTADDLVADAERCARNSCRRSR